MADALLPSAFAELEPLRRNLVPGNRNRAVGHAAGQHRWPEMREFYDAFFPRLEEAIEYCDKFPLDDLPEDALNLLHLIYSLIMVAMAVEILHQPEPADAADAVMIRISAPVP